MHAYIYIHSEFFFSVNGKLKLVLDNIPRVKILFFPKVTSFVSFRLPKINNKNNCVMETIQYFLHARLEKKYIRCLIDLRLSE